MHIAEVCNKYNISADTLRYYERVGIIPPVGRTASGIRNYTDEDLGWVENACCMRAAGVSVETIIEYVRLFQEGSDTLETRRDLLVEAKDDIDQRISCLQDELHRLTHKIACYNRAVKTGVLSWDACDEEEDESSEHLLFSFYEKRKPFSLRKEKARPLREDTACCLRRFLTPKTFAVWILTN